VNLVIHRLASDTARPLATVLPPAVNTPLLWGWKHPFNSNSTKISRQSSAGIKW